MKIRFQADNGLNKAIVRAVVRRERAVDFRSAQSARMDHDPHPDVLSGSAQTGRILVWAANANESENRLCLVPSLVSIAVGSKSKVTI